MSEELEVLTLVTRRLNDAAIPSMVTGSIATNFYAVPRMTRDIDIVVDLVESDAPRLLDLFRTDFYIDPDTVRTAARTRGMFNIIHLKHVVKVDFVVRKDDVYRREEFARRRPVEVEGHRFWIASPEDLILSKLVWARESRSELQFGDVKNLLRSVDGLDREYLVRWAEHLGVGALYREFSA